VAVPKKLMNLPSKAIFIGICLLAVLGVSRSAFAVGIMVNEYLNASTGGSEPGPLLNKMAADEYIEFVITEDTSASTLASLTFGSTQAATSALKGVFGFDLTTLNSVLSAAGQTNFLAGTIIVVKGGVPVWVRHRT
jgi:hypothetical protein